MRFFYALSPNLFDEVGHIYPYHRALARAVEQNGWIYTNYVPRGVQLKSLPPRWIEALPPDFWNRKKGGLFRLRMVFAGFFSLRSLFRTMENKSDTIVFLEHFELQNLASLFLALLFTRPRFSLWILHRYDYGASHFKTKIYRFFHWAMEKKLKIFYLTDSDLLQEAQASHFQKKIHVVPIPHTQAAISLNSERNPHLLWWPGGSTRQDKGLSVIQQLGAKIPAPFQLALAEGARPFLAPSSKLLFLPTVLSEEEYALWMQRASFVLLPHRPETYGKRTSGIFVEAVVAGAIPLVSKGTWMAYELEKFGVRASLCDWDKEDLFSKLGAPFPDKEALLRMQKRYRSFHSEKGFAEALQRISL